jgi:hypothetical protein
MLSFFVTVLLNYEMLYIKRNWPCIIYHMQIQIIELEIKEISAPFHLGESEVSRAKGVPCLSLNIVASHFHCHITKLLPNVLTNKEREELHPDKVLF